MEQWAFDNARNIRVSTDMTQADQQTNGLWATLQQVTSLQVQDKAITLASGWLLTHDMLDIVSSVTNWSIVIDKTCKWTEGPPQTVITHRLPALTGLHIPDVSLTDELLLLLLVYCRSLTQLSVLDVDLKSSHAHWAVERWGTLGVRRGTVDTEMLPGALRAPYAVQTSHGVTLKVILPSFTLSSTKVRVFVCLRHVQPCTAQVTCVGHSMHTYSYHAEPAIPQHAGCGYAAYDVSTWGAACVYVCSCRCQPT